MEFKKIVSGLLLMSLCFCLAGCGADNTELSDQEVHPIGSEIIETDETSDIIETNNIAEETEDESVRTEIVLNGEDISAGDGVTVSGSTAAISEAGTYEISGNLNDGQIIVDAAGEVELILNSVNIYCSASSPIYVKEAENVMITLTDGTVNTLADDSSYDIEDTVDGPDAVIYSKADLVISGSGSLNVTANYKDGITSKDTLRIENGTISVTAVNHGIKGKDYLMINDGTIVAEAGGDGIKATNDTEVSFGYVEINGGNIEINAVDDGISAVSDIKVTNGTININSDNNGMKSDDSITITGGTITVQTEDDGLVCLEKTIAAESVVKVNGSVISE